MHKLFITPLIFCCNWPDMNSDNSYTGYVDMIWNNISEILEMLMEQYVIITYSVITLMIQIQTFSFKN